MGSHLEYLNKVAQLGRLNRHQMTQIALDLNARINRLLSRKRAFVYVVVTVPLDADGRPLMAETRSAYAKYEAKNEDAVYYAGQKEFETKNTSEKVMKDIVIALE